MGTVDSKKQLVMEIPNVYADGSLTKITWLAGSRYDCVRIPNTFVVHLQPRTALEGVELEGNEVVSITKKASKATKISCGWRLQQVNDVLVAPLPSTQILRIVNKD